MIFLFIITDQRRSKEVNTTPRGEQLRRPQLAEHRRAGDVGRQGRGRVPGHQRLCPLQRPLLASGRQEDAGTHQRPDHRTARDEGRPFPEDIRSDPTAQMQAHPRPSQAKALQ